MGLKKLARKLKGGPGSGNWGHGGRPGKRGGSSPGKGGRASMSGKKLSSNGQIANFAKQENVIPVMPEDSKPHMAYDNRFAYNNKHNVYTLQGRKQNSPGNAYARDVIYDSNLKINKYTEDVYS